MHIVDRIEVKAGKARIQEAGRLSDEAEAHVQRFLKAFASVAAVDSADIRIHLCDNFKKAGEKGEAAVYANHLIEGAAPSEIHVALNVERAALRAADGAFEDAAIIVAAKTAAARHGLDEKIGSGFGWVPAAAALALAHPAFGKAQVKAPKGAKTVPYADRYISLALVSGMSAKDLAVAAFRKTSIPKTLILARQELQANPPVLPVALSALAAIAAQALDRARETDEPGAEAFSSPAAA